MCRFADGFLSVSGTLRSNLDPFGLYDDARLWDALRRAYLVDTYEKRPPSNQTTTQGHAQATGSRFDLDTPIEDGGNNLSVGQVKLAPIFSSSFLVVYYYPAIIGVVGTSASP